MRRSIRSAKRSPDRAPAARPVAQPQSSFSGGVAEYMFGHETGRVRRHRQAVCGRARARIQPHARPAAHRSRPAHPRDRHRRLAVHGAGQRQNHLPARSIRAAGAQCAGCAPTSIAPARSIANAARGRRARRHPTRSISKITPASPSPSPGMAIPSIHACAPPAKPFSARLSPFADRIKLLLLMIEGDIGKTFGRLLHRELNWPGKIVSLDGMELQELDYVDVGELIAPPGVVPVVIKSCCLRIASSRRYPYHDRRLPGAAQHEVMRCRPGNVTDFGVPGSAVHQQQRFHARRRAFARCTASGKHNVKPNDRTLVIYYDCLAKGPEETNERPRKAASQSEPSRTEPSRTALRHRSLSRLACR